MRAIDLSLFLIALGALPLTPQSPDPTTKPVEEAEDSAREIVSRLREKTRHQSCTATYRLIKKDTEETLRISYQAPSALRIDLGNDDGSMTMWVLAERWAVQSNMKGRSTAMDVDPTLVFGAAVLEVLSKEFPPPADMEEGAGGYLAFRLHPDKPTEDGSYLEFELGWQAQRRHALGWFAGSKDSNDLDVDEKRLFHDYASGAKFSLSRESGWPSEIMHPKGSRLELVEFVASVEDSDFVIPAPTEVMQDETQNFIISLAPAMWYQQRSLAYYGASCASRDKLYEEEVVHEKVARVFTVMYRAEMHRSFGRWIESGENGIDEFATWCEEELERIGDDSELRAELDEAIAEWKADFVKTLEDGIDGYVSLIPEFKYPPQQSVSNDDRFDAEFVPAIFLTEKKVAHQAFQVEIATPLLEKFETRMREIGALK